MNTTISSVPRFERRYGWANRILRVDLTARRIWAQEATPYIPHYLGARGIAARICWEEYPQPVDPFDPANPLMIVPAALTGSTSPYSGRTNVCAFSPQAAPHYWFTRSNIGGHFGGELKRAGYDALIVTGAAETPVRLRIRDDEVSILPADDLWGEDALDTLEALGSLEEKGASSMAIGPSGERLSRIATIQAGSSTACGQGGFGAVMGSKRLKAISVTGSGRVPLARPEITLQIARALSREVTPPAVRDTEKMRRELSPDGGGRVRHSACTESCVTPCVPDCRDIPGWVYPGRKWSGVWFCIAEVLLAGSQDSSAPHFREVFDWRLSRRAAFEMNVLCNRYALNEFDLLMGLVPWLIACQKAGLISELNGRAMEWSSPEFWAHFLHAIAYRQGLGDALAEGGWAAAHGLHLGEALAQARYPGWGCPGHWDGHDGSSYAPYPFWIVPALQWLSDTRDPISGGHGYLHATGPIRNALTLADAAAVAAAVDQARSVSQRAYGDPIVMDPYGGYQGKAYPAAFHAVHAVVKDCVPVDDMIFPLISSVKSPDGFWCLHDIEGVGDIAGPSIEYHIFQAGTGVGWSEAEFRQAADRVCTVERALQVRHFGRDRHMDEMVLPYFERTECYHNPLLGRRFGLDREQFAPVLDEFYRLRGWDTETAWPTAQRLGELGLGEMHQPMVEGAQRAQAEPTADDCVTMERS